MNFDPTFWNAFHDMLEASEDETPATPPKVKGTTYRLRLKGWEQRLDLIYKILTRDHLVIRINEH